MSLLVMKILLGLAGAGYLTAGALHLGQKSRAAWIVNFAAWGLNAAVVGGNWIHNGYVPFVSMYQVLTFLGLCFTLCALFVRYVFRDTCSQPVFCLCAGVVMVGSLCMDATLIWHFVPALQSVWFVPHVFCYMLSYSLCAVASVLAVAWYIHRPADGALDSVYHLVLVAFPFMTMGMLFGAIWANAVWTEFWSWDAKENWALITWLCYSLYLHCRRHKALQKLALPFVIAGLAALFMAFQGVNLFGNGGVHAYT